MTSWCVAGEINTMQGNLNWVASREHTFKHPVWKGREEEFTPVCRSEESDSANLDRMAEVLVRSGIDAAKAVMLLVPEAYRNHPDLVKQYPEVRQCQKEGEQSFFCLKALFRLQVVVS